MSGIYTLGSGLPITPFWNGAAPSGSGESSNDRPNVVGNANNGPKRWDAWFNTAAFVAAADGNVWQRRPQHRHRTAHQLGGLLGGEVDADQRAASTCSSASEFFNIFNHPNFALPNVTVNSSGFGTIASTPDVANGNPLGDGGPRLVQLALKLVF